MTPTSRIGIAAAVLAAVAATELAVRRTALAAMVAGTPVTPDRDQARTWAAEELARPEYRVARPGLTERIIGWIRDTLDHLSLPGGPQASAGLAVLLAVLVVVIGLIVLRTGGWRATGRVERLDLFAGRELTAAEHRAAADAAGEAGDWSTAVLERFRAVVRELEERAVLTPQPGRTADEAAAEASRWLPALADPLRSAALLFDEVRYGDRPADRDTASRLRSVDDQVRRARPSDSPVAGIPQLVVPS